MPGYRFFLVAKNGHIHAPPMNVEATGDAEALKRAREHLQSGDVEVWQGTRLVAYLVSEQFSPVVKVCTESESPPSQRISTNADVASQ